MDGPVVAPREGDGPNSEAVAVSPSSVWPNGHFVAKPEERHLGTVLVYETTDRGAFELHRTAGGVFRLNTRERTLVRRRRVAPERG